MSFELGVLDGLEKAAERKKRLKRTAVGAAAGYGAGTAAKKLLRAAHHLSSKKATKRLFNRLGPLSGPAAVGVHMLPAAGAAGGAGAGWRKKAAAAKKKSKKRLKRTAGGALSGYGVGHLARFITRKPYYRYAHKALPRPLSVARDIGVMGREFAPQIGAVAGGVKGYRKKS